MTINTNNLVAHWNKNRYSEDAMLENASALRDGLHAFCKNGIIDIETMIRELSNIEKAVVIYSKKFKN